MAALSLARPLRARPPRRVLVLGAGLAGLVAAYELQRAGHEVRVLEAQLQPGGRVLTQRGFADGLHAEAGAISIPDTHALPLHYAREFGLAFETAPAQDLAAVRYLQGRRLRLQGDVAPDWPYALGAQERALGPRGLLAQYRDPLLAEIGDPAAEDWRAQDYAALDAQSLPQLLRARGASEAAVALMCAGWGDLWGEGLHTVSALAVLRDLLLQLGALQHHRLLGGNDALPRAFAQRLAPRIEYGVQAVAIEQNRGGVRVQAQRRGLRESFEAERLVCAIPYSVLRALELPPQWSAGKRRAIAQLRWFSAARVSLQMRSRYWIERGDAGAAQTDLGSITAVYDMTAAQPGPRGILHTYSGGAAARRLQALPRDQRIEQVLQALERVHPGAQAHCEGGAAWCWDEAPFARGASSWFAPGELAELGPHLAAPEGRVHFAGDHTSPWLRWMQGALHSGLRAAREVHEAAD